MFGDEEEKGRPYTLAIHVSTRDRTSGQGARKAQQLIRRLDLSTYMFQGYGITQGNARST